MLQLVKDCTVVIVFFVALVVALLLPGKASGGASPHVHIDIGKYL